MKTVLGLLLPVLILFQRVASHGYVAELIVDGQSYDGQEPTEDGSATVASVVDRISTIDPVKGATNPYVNCGQKSTAASLVAAVNPGSAVQFQWEAGGGQHWPHDMGPLMFYMASCGDNCDQFDSTTAKWFKVAQVGLQSDGETWYLKNLMSGVPANFTMPQNIAPGNYIFRQEIIALHLANEKGGAEFYPSCSRITVSGSGTGAPTDEELVSFPGAYSDTDPGIYVPGMFDGLNGKYSFPGPSIAAFVSGSSSGGATQTSSTSTQTSSKSASTATGTSSGSTAEGKCRLTKQTTNLKRSVSRPHRFSRIMSNLLHGRSF